MVSEFKVGAVCRDLKVLESLGDYSSAVCSIEIGRALRVLPGRREVYAATLLEGNVAVVVKRYLQHPKQVRDWKAEWSGLCGLKQRSMPSAEPVCVLQSQGDESIWVVMLQIEGAVNLGQYFAENNASVVTQVVGEWVHLVDDLHANGVRQRDQHIDNWVIAEERLYLLDAGTVQFEESALDDELRVSDLSSLCVVVPPAVEAIFRSKLESIYLAEDAIRREALLAKLDSAIATLQQGRARRYYKKTRRDCTEFTVRQAAGYTGMSSNAADPDLVDALFKDPEALMLQGECVKAGNTCTVQRFEWMGRYYILKRYNSKALFDRLRRAFSDSRAKISWSSACLLNLAFIPTAPVVGFYEERRGWLRGRCYLLMEELAGSLLPKYVAENLDSPERIEKVAESFACVWRSLRRLRAAHGDLKATNLIVSPDGTVHLFDLDAFQFGLGMSSFTKKRLKDYNRFMKNWEHEPQVRQVFEKALEEEAF